MLLFIIVQSHHFSLLNKANKRRIYGLELLSITLLVSECSSDYDGESECFTHLVVSAIGYLIFQFVFCFVFRPALAIIRVTATVTYTSPQGGQWRVRKPLLSPCGLRWIQRNTQGPYLEGPLVLHLISISKASLAHVISYRMLIRQP
jgi:hypothetical protein